MSSSGDTAERDVSDRLVLDRSSRMSCPKRRPQTPGGPKHREAPNTGRPQTPGGPKHREAPNTGRPTHKATITASLAKLLAPRMRQNTPTRPRLRLCEGRRIFV